MSEKKYCSSCLQFRLAEKGKIVSTANKHIKRFKCSLCLSKMITPKKDMYVSRTYQNS
jgi:transposase-like protein